MSDATSTAEESHQPASNWGTYKRLLAYVKPFWLAFSLAVVGNIIYAAASTGMAAAMEYVITALENPTDKNRILLTLLIVGVFAFRIFNLENKT